MSIHKNIKILTWLNFCLDFRIYNAITVLYFVEITGSFAFGTSSVAQSSLMQKEFSNEQRATMGSLNSLAKSLFFGITSILLGLWADKVGPTYALLTGQVLLAPVILLHWRLFKKS